MGNVSRTSTVPTGATAAARRPKRKFATKYSNSPTDRPIIAKARPMPRKPNRMYGLRRLLMSDRLPQRMLAGTEAMEVMALTMPTSARLALRVCAMNRGMRFEVEPPAML